MQGPFRVVAAMKNNGHWEDACAADMGWRGMQIYHERSDGLNSPSSSNILRYIFSVPLSY